MSQETEIRMEAYREMIWIAVDDSTIAGIFRGGWLKVMIEDTVRTFLKNGTLWAELRLTEYVQGLLADYPLEKVKAILEVKIENYKDVLFASRHSKHTKSTE